MNFVNPNPPTRLEINLGRTPRWLGLVVSLLIMAALIGTVCLYAAYDPDVFRTPKVTVPNVSAEIQNKVDDVVKKVVKQ